MSELLNAEDAQTARAFSASWNHAETGSVYTKQQFLDWFVPLDPSCFSGKTVIELGFGNGSLLYHMAEYSPARLCGIELGDTLSTTRQNLRSYTKCAIELHRGDLTQANLGQFDLVYCIGVLHHLQDPEKGFQAVLRHTKPGGYFHCWVYAREGNNLIIYLVDPIRRLACRLPWWLTKYGIALPLVIPYYIYSKLLKLISRLWPSVRILEKILPLYHYSLWIAERPLRFYHHVAFDQLVTPQTTYLRRSVIENWLQQTDVNLNTSYIIFRNGNSWKFGGRKHGP